AFSFLFCLTLGLFLGLAFSFLFCLALGLFLGLAFSFLFCLTLGLFLGFAFSFLFCLTFGLFLGLALSLFTLFFGFGQSNVRILFGGKRGSRFSIRLWLRLRFGLSSLWCFCFRGFWFLSFSFLRLCCWVWIVGLG